MNYLKLILNGFLSTITIIIVLGVLYFFWATQSNSSLLNLSFGSLLIYKYQPDPPGFAFGNGLFLISILGGLFNALFIKFQKPKSKKGEEVNTNGQSQ
jgi:hypothetical protein